MDSLRIAGAIGFGVALLALAGLGLSGLGTRWGLWDYHVGFTVLRYAAYAGVAGALLALLGIVSARGPMQALAVAGVAIGLAAAWVPYQWMSTAKSVPPIHDITTDTESPPAFEAVLELRKNAVNSAQYGGQEIAAQQRKGYPNLSPLTLPDPPAVAFARALEAAKDNGWEIVAQDPAKGVIEATDTTFWFGFKDDVVVRLTPQGSGTKVDVRSVSRVGKSDVGTNAKRIETYLDKLGK